MEEKLKNQSDEYNAVVRRKIAESEELQKREMQKISENFDKELKKYGEQLANTNADIKRGYKDALKKIDEAKQ